MNIENEKRGLSVLARELEEARESAPGKSGFELFAFENVAAALLSRARFDSNVPLEQAQQLISKAILNTGEAGIVTAAALRRELQNQETLFLKSTPKRYHLVTSISMRRHGVVPGRKRIGGVGLEFSAFLPKGLTRKPLQEMVGDPEFFHLNQRYTVVKISTKGRSPSEAAQRALDGLDILRGIWNFSLNSCVGIRQSGHPHPFNKIRNGRVHSLHDVRSGAAMQNYWWEQETYSKEFSPTQRGWADLFEAEKKVRKALAGSSFRAWIEEGLIRYVRSLDSSDLEKSFLRLWGVLEYLTGTEMLNNEITIHRAAAMRIRTKYSEEILNHLRHARNSVIHVGIEHPNYGILICQLKGFVETLMWWHIGGSSGAKSIAEANAFLDLPLEEPALRQALADSRRKASICQQRLSLLGNE